MKLLIVVVNYNATDLTIDCLDSLVDEMASMPWAHVGLCDNGSTEEESDRLERTVKQRGWQDWISFTHLDPNLGFCGGNNAVIRPAIASDSQPEYVMLLNNDTIVRPGAIQILVDFMDAHPDAGIAGSRLEDPDGTPQVSAFGFSGVASEFDRGLKTGLVSRLLRRWLVRQPVPNVTCRTDWIPGASMIIRKQVIADVGVLDEGFYTYFDDIDYCLNAARRGWPTWYVPTSRIVHLVGATTGMAKVEAQAPRPERVPSYWFQARRRFYLKNHGPFRAMLVDFAFLAGIIPGRVKRLLIGQGYLDPPHLIGDFLSHSVFCRGFQVKDVSNPALVETGS